MEENEKVKMSLLYDPETGQALSVMQDDNAEFYFPLVFPGPTFEGAIKDEFHQFAVILDGDEPSTICYSQATAYELADYWEEHEGREFNVALLPYENPQILGEDKESTNIRIIDYLLDFRELRDIPEDVEITGKLHEEFMDYVFEKEEELKRFVKGEAA